MSDTTIDTLPPVTPEPTAAKSPLARVIGVLFEPGATFADIARVPNFIVPMLILIVTAFAMSYTIATRLDMGEFTKQKILQSPNGASMPKDQLEKVAERTNTFTKYKSYCQPLFTALWLTVTSGIFILMANFIFGGTASFKQIFSAVTYAKMPEAIYAIIVTVVLYIKDPSDVDPENIVAANLGMVVTNETSKFLHTFFIMVEPFAIWQCVLLAFGIAAAAKISFGKALAAVLIPFMIIVLIMSGLAAMR